MTCLIIDDEILAQDVIEHYISRVASLELYGKCSNALEAFAILSKQEIDLIFLDIQMPELSGLDFIKLLKKPPKIILTTAYTEYALDGYELNVIDYLLKPVSFERFLKAVDKVQALQQPAAAAAEKVQPAPAVQDIFVKSDGKLVRVNTAEIRYVEGLKNYLLIHTLSRRIIVHGTMGHMEEELKALGNFIRIHKSYIVNKNSITEIAGNMVKIEQTELPIGGVYKNDLLRLLKVI
jgi:DNA-binding LytR/AlgR family response regulator